MDFKKLFYLPDLASSHGHEIDLMIYLIHILMFVLFFGWGAYLIFVSIRFSKKLNPKADYKGLRSPFIKQIEVFVIVLEAILLIGFSIPFWAKQVGSFPTRADKIEVRVNAEQFAWNIHYSGKDGIFGETSYDYLDKQSNPMGINPNDPFGKDDITTINQLHLPVGKPAIIHLTSRDVVHSFSLPEMRVKQDVIPGMSIPTWFTPTKTGNWEIACAQLCGLGHYRMKGFLTIHSQEDFKSWIDKNTPAAEGEGGGGFDDFWN